MEEDEFWNEFKSMELTSTATAIVRIKHVLLDLEYKRRTPRAREHSSNSPAKNSYYYTSLSIAQKQLLHVGRLLFSRKFTTVMFVSL